MEANLMVDKQVMNKKTFYIPQDLIDRLQDYSNKIGLSMSDIVRVSVNEYLRAHPLEVKNNTKVTK